MSALRDDALLEGVRGALEQSLLALADRREPASHDGAASGPKPRPASPAGVAGPIREAIAIVSRFLEAAPDDDAALDALEQATSAVAATREQLAGDEAVARLVDGAVRVLEGALDELIRRSPHRGRKAEGTRRSDEILASRGVPRAHRIEVPAPRLLARDAVAASEERAIARSDEPVSGDFAQVRAIARDCFEDLASLGSLRRLYDTEPWIDAGPFEERLLDNLDALVALERPVDPGAPPVGLVDALYAYATEWFIPDYGRTFALAFTLSCVASETAMRWVVLALRRSHPRVYPAFVDALALGSSEAIDRTLVELCADNDAAIVSVALQAMARRGRPDMASMVLVLMRPAPELVAEATDLAARLPAQAAVPLRAFWEGADPVAAASAAAALATLGEGRGITHLRGVLQGAAAPEPARRIAFESLCLLGSPGDRALVAAFAGADPERLAFLAWHGHPDHVPLLAAALQRAIAANETGGSYAIADLLAAALERIGGGTAPRITALGAADVEARVEAWTRSYEERRPLDATRLRFGLGWTPQAIVAELSARETKQGARPLLARELAFVTRRAVHLDVTGWVAAQEQQLAACKDLVEPRA